MKHISLDRAPEGIKRFVRSLAIDPSGSILELNGEPVVQVQPPRRRVNRARLKAAILKRRKDSRASNAEWSVADRELWNRVPSPEQ